MDFRPSKPPKSRNITILAACDLRTRIKGLLPPGLGASVEPAPAARPVWIGNGGSVYFLYHTLPVSSISQITTGKLMKLLSSDLKRLSIT